MKNKLAQMPIERMGLDIMHPATVIFGVGGYSLTVGDVLEARQESQDMRDKVLYTCLGKGGLYELVGNAIGAGTSKENGELVVYRDACTGVPFYRTEEDFRRRMQRVHVEG